MPVTRRESRASHAGIDAGISLEQILDNFEQCTYPRAHAVRRKHIAQNRDIVRANTLAQLRIRELETRVLALEQERAQHTLQAGQQQAHVRRLEYALECVRVGWETMAQGLNDAGVGARAGAVAAPAQPSARVSLGDMPSTRVWVSRSVAPMEEIGEAPEEDGDLGEDVRLDAPDDAVGDSGDEQLAQDGAMAAPDDEAMSASPRVSATDNVAVPLTGDVCPASVTRRRISRRHSQMPAGEASVHGGLDEDTAQAADDATQAADDAAQVADDAEREVVAPESDAPASPSPMHAPAADAAAATSAARPETPPADAPPAPTTPPRAPTYPEPRKRGRASRASLAEPAEELAPLGARRARKSVNYALPKLNTKMRKPDSDHDDEKPRRGQRRSTADKSDARPTRRTDAGRPRAGAHTGGEEPGAETDAPGDGAEADAAHGAQKTDAEQNQGPEAEQPTEEPPGAEADPEPRSPRHARAADREAPQDARSPPTEAEATRAPDAAHGAVLPPASPAPRTTPLKRPRRSEAAHALLRPDAAHAPRSATPHTKRAVPPAARAETVRAARARTPFAPRTRPGAASVLQQHSAQNMPPWASSLLNLASPDPPRAARKPRASLETSPTRRTRRGKENVDVQ